MLTHQKIEKSVERLQYIEVSPVVSEDEDRRTGSTSTPGSPSGIEPPQSEPDSEPTKLDLESARACSDLHKLTERIIGKSGVTMTAELIARVAIMVSRCLLA
jgi:hypothetical protein